MIATILSGGIGNQLFMYAAARALALKNKTSLILNIDKGFRNDVTYKRNFELEVFNLEYRQCPILTFDTHFGKIIHKISLLVGRNILSPTYKILRDSTKNRGVDDRLLCSEGCNYFLEGYWQSEKYFKGFEKEIRKDLVFNFEKSEVLSKEEVQIFEDKRSTPVCIGVRRYQECTGSLSFSITDKSFYIRAMNYILLKVNNPVFYVFTQDKEWVLNNLNPNKKYDIRFVAEKENSTIEDLYLMTRFKYHIISNSSFYWWGAWLANGEIVISTNNFINKESNCESWIII